ncbi:MAG: hypothetical protein M3P33_03150 [bacterium]|nr:hypothetical protein [bacterium]
MKLSSRYIYGAIALLIMLIVVIFACKDAYYSDQTKSNDISNNTTIKITNNPASKKIQNYTNQKAHISFNYSTEWSMGECFLSQKSDSANIQIDFNNKDNDNGTCIPSKESYPNMQLLVFLGSNRIEKDFPFSDSHNWTTDSKTVTINNLEYNRTLFFAQSDSNPKYVMSYYYVDTVNGNVIVFKEFGNTNSSDIESILKSVSII